MTTADTYLISLASGNNGRQRANLTFRGNVKQGRHGWLRLTPAYSLHVVNEIVDKMTSDDVVLDPFSGTATTTLASTIHGIQADSVDINPFLVWFGNLKISRFGHDTPDELREAGRGVVHALRRPSSKRIRWAPNLHQIEKWWDEETLSTLSELFVFIREMDASAILKDLLRVAFCKVMISTSNASFGHQSMSFKKVKPPRGRQPTLFEGPDEQDRRLHVLKLFEESVDSVASGVEEDSPVAKGKVILGDSRHLDRVLKDKTYSVVITSPPYPNRMSYIRELRPYMYWLGFLENGRQAGNLDWEAIGGTWGCATSNLGSWEPSNGPVGFGSFETIVSRIGAKHGLLGKYVHRYFDDVKVHIRSLRSVLKPDARCFYVVGNSKFYDTLLPVEEIYAALFEDAGFTGVGWKAIRKRNSKKELFEYVVYASNPSVVSRNQRVNGSRASC